MESSEAPGVKKALVSLGSSNSKVWEANQYTNINEELWHLYLESYKTKILSPLDADS